MQSKTLYNHERITNDRNLGPHPHAFKVVLLVKNATSGRPCKLYKDSLARYYIIADNVANSPCLFKAREQLRKLAKQCFMNEIQPGTPNSRDWRTHAAIFNPNPGFCDIKPTSFMAHIGFHNPLLIVAVVAVMLLGVFVYCLLYTSPSPRDS